MKIKKYSISIAMVLLVSTHITIASSKGAPPRLPVQKNTQLPKTSSHYSQAIDREADADTYEFVIPEADQPQSPASPAPTGAIAQTQVYRAQPRNTSSGTATFLSLQGNIDGQQVPARGESSFNNTTNVQGGWVTVKPQAKKPVPVQLLSLEDNVIFDTTHIDTAPETSSFISGNPLTNPMRTTSAPNFRTLHENTNAEFTTSVNQDNSQAMPQESIINGKASVKIMEQRPRLTQEEINAASLGRTQKKYKPRTKAKPLQKDKDLEPIAEQIDDNLSLESDEDTQEIATNKLKIENALQKTNPILSLIEEYNDNESTHNITMKERTPKTIEMYTTAIQQATDASIEQILKNPRLSLDSKITQLQSFKDQFPSSATGELYKLGSLRRDEINKKVPYKDIVNNSYTRAIDTLKTEGVTIAKLNQDIVTLKENSNKALSNFMSTGNTADLNEFMSNSMMALWKRGAVTTKTIGQTLNNLFKVSKTKLPQDAVDSIVIDLEPDMPSPNSSIEQQAHWFTRASHMISKTISDTIYGTAEQQLAKKLSQDFQDEAQNITHRSFNSTSEADAALKKMVNNIINEVRPGLSESQRTTLMETILTGDLTTEKPSLQQFPRFYEKSPNIKPHPSLWQDSNGYSMTISDFIPAKFNTWMQKTVQLINEKTQ